MITFQQISDAMADITAFDPEGDSTDAFGHGKFCEAHGIDLEVLNEIADEGMMYLQLMGSQGVELGRELYTGGFLAGFQVAMTLSARAIGPEDADAIATGKGAQS